MNIEVLAMRKKCPIEYTLSLINGKWKILIIKELSQTPLRYGDLRKLLSFISPKVLIQNLRELEEAKLIDREIFPEIPPKVEYSLNEKGRSLYNIFIELRKWGLNENLDNIECKMCKKCQLILSSVE